jgi:hypothetical protein
MVQTKIYAISQITMRFGREAILEALVVMTNTDSEGSKKNNTTLVDGILISNFFPNVEMQIKKETRKIMSPLKYAATALTIE